MPELKKYQMFIDGQWVDSDTKKTFETLNPENNNTHKLGLTEQTVSNWHRSAECEWNFWIWEQL